MAQRQHDLEEAPIEAQADDQIVERRLASRGLWRIGACIVVVFAVFLAGAVTQRFYGLGNLARALNPGYVPLSKRTALLPAHVGRLDIFVLAGQSNMEGAGRLSEYTPLDTFGRVYSFGPDFKWQVAREPIAGNAVGPGLAFAHHLAAAGRIVGLVPCARGGTGIARWQRSLGEQSLYGKCLMKTKAASVTGRIAGLLFFQGEHDAATDEGANWDDHFARFVKDFRADANDEGLPVVFAQIGAGSSDGWRTVKHRQASVSLPNVRMIKTDDLEYYPGGIHFSTKSQLEIGRRFAQTIAPR